ncbi:nuclear protein 96-domain-containing protein [Glomus cerebriforme]|uniref:Nuclear protein 96-domain-containing protein n=1 Tax=Glomus cerebriforme TaxID=658196 RepID=A0A397TKQ3_9GLOM|nr:nuclear protein 96-domain-containing protein [Glomus cerebriforme]
MVRSFRVGWGLNGTYVHRSKKNLRPIYTPFIVRTAPSRIAKAQRDIVKFRKVLIVSEEDRYIKERISKSLELIFERSTFGQEDDTPYINPAELGFMDFISVFDTKTIDEHEILTWKLCYALWDDLQIPSEHYDSMSLTKVTKDCRKARISKWFQIASELKMTDHLKLSGYSNDDTDLIFAHLTSKQISKASLIAIKNRDFHLASLLSQSYGNDYVKECMKQQLDHWKETEVNKLILPNYLKFFELLSGNVFATTKGLDWRTVIGMQMWYGCKLDDSFDEALAIYEEARRSSEDISTPFVWYNQSHAVYGSDHWAYLDANKQTLDLHYHLMKLSTDPTHPLGDALHPRTNHIAPLDYRVTWLLHYMIARILRICDLSDGGITVDQLSLKFIFELETLGIWQWAVFIAMFINEPDVRKNVLCELLSRYVHQIPKEKVENFQNFAIKTMQLKEEWLSNSQEIFSKYKEAPGRKRKFSY